MRPENQSLNDSSKTFPGTVLPVMDKIPERLQLGEKGGEKEFEITAVFQRWEARISEARPKTGPCRDQLCAGRQVCQHLRLSWAGCPSTEQLLLLQMKSRH